MVSTRSSAEAKVKNSSLCGSFMLPWHNFFYPLVTSLHSNLIVHHVQKFFGLDPVSGRSPTLFGKLAYAFFRVATSLGDDVYYFLPFVYWFALPVGIPFSTAFGLIITAGQFIKDMSCLPRPPKQFSYNGKTCHIAKLENHYSTEYGLPSTHAMSGTLSFTVLIALDRLKLLDGDNNGPMIFGLGTILTMSCALSRLYMGVHSVYDVAVGLMLAFTLHCTLLIPYGEQIDHYLYHEEQGILVTLTALLWFTCFYPATTPWSASWGTASQLFGVWSGISLGLHVVFVHQPELGQLLLSSSLLDVPISQWDWPVLVTKSMSGLVTLLITIVIIKKATLAFMISLIKNGIVTIPKAEKFDTAGDPVPLKKSYMVEIPTRLMSYGITSFVVIVGVPLVWSYLL
jgi:sphingosine-1-phosphate phosphatase 1